MKSRNQGTVQKGFNGAGASKDQQGSVSFASHLLRSNGLLSLFQIAVGFGLLLCCVLVCGFGGFVAHGVLPFV
jgi:hypothetical protein